MRGWLPAYRGGARLFRRWPSFRAPELSLEVVPWTGPRGPGPHLELLNMGTEGARFPGGVREVWCCRSRDLDPWPLLGLLFRQRLARVAEADPIADEEFAVKRWSCSTLQRPIPELGELGERGSVTLWEERVPLLSLGG